CSALLVREEVSFPDYFDSALLLLLRVLLKPVGFDFAGFNAELQPDACLLPLPAGQTLRPFLRHRRQSAAVWTPRFEAQIDKCLELSEYLYNKIKDREGYEMVFDGKPQHTNVCFWYLPPGIRYMEDKEEKKKRLHKVAPVIKARMMEYGTTMVSYQPQGDKVNFFRMVISNPAATFEDIDFLIEEIERLGHDL
ncbi:Glutamate decarboxylase 2, partial [Xenoophorus captivus]